jgi:hypothetical protein
LVFDFLSNHVCRVESSEETQIRTEQELGVWAFKFEVIGESKTQTWKIKKSVKSKRIKDEREI